VINGLSGSSTTGVVEPFAGQVVAASFAVH
jgi:hypothetical protein